MFTEYLLVPQSWRRALAWARVVLAAALVLVHVLLPSVAGTTRAVVAAAYLAMSVGALTVRRLEALSYDPLGLLADAALLVLAASHPVEEVRWLSLCVALLVLLRASLLFEGRHVALLAGATTAFLLVARPPQEGVLWQVMAAGGTVATVLVLQRGLLQDRLSTAFHRVVLSRSEAEAARTEERLRLAHNFHDGPLQSFISYQMRLEILRRLLGRDLEAARRELEALQELTRAQVGELRSFVRTMRENDEAEPTRLDAALRQATRQFTQESGITVALEPPEFDAPLDTERSMEAFQIVREALNNVQKHSRASRVTIQVRPEPAGISLCVEDDGGGFPFAGAFKLEELDALRLGPASIRRRVRNLDGELTVESRPGQGTKLDVRVPA